MIVDPRDRIAPAPVKSRRWIILTLSGAMAITALAGGGGLVAYLSRELAYAIPSEVVARLDPKMRPVAARLVTEPCNRTLAGQLVDDMLDQAENRAVVAFIERTKATCGPNEKLLRPLLSAQMDSSDFLGAERTSDDLIENYPANPSVYAWRSEAREKNGDFTGAYADRRTEFSLFLDPSDVELSVYYDVARLAAKTGNPCEAAAILRDYVAYDPEQRRTQQLSTVTQRWQKQGTCPPLSGTGTALLRYDANATAIIVPVAVNGVHGRMIVDTGASRTMLSKEFARGAGIEASGEAAVTTVNGKAWVSAGRAEFIAVGNARLNDVPVYIQQSTGGSLGEGVDGLLGLSFLGNFHARIGGGSIELRPLE